MRLECLQVGPASKDSLLALSGTPLVDEKIDLSEILSDRITTTTR